MTLTWSTIAFELVKLTFQGGGALLVAWFAVRWALSRYKKEKTWERQLAAFADVISALSEMRFVAGRKMDQLEGTWSSNEHNDNMLAERYRTARRKFDEGLAVAQLILPDATHKAVAKLNEDLERIDDPGPWKAYTLEYSLIDDALHVLTLDGRSILGIRNELKN